jgi:hypothetical protein
MAEEKREEKSVEKNAKVYGDEADKVLDRISAFRDVVVNAGLISAEEISKAIVSGIEIGKEAASLEKTAEAIKKNSKTKTAEAIKKSVWLIGEKLETALKVKGITAGIISQAIEKEVATLSRIKEAARKVLEEISAESFYKAEVERQGAGRQAGMSITSIEYVKGYFNIKDDVLDDRITFFIPVVEKEYLAIRNLAFETDGKGNTIYPPDAEETAALMIMYKLKSAAKVSVCGNCVKTEQAVSQESWGDHSISYLEDKESSNEGDKIKHGYPISIASRIARYVGFKAVNAHE